MHLWGIQVMGVRITVPWQYGPSDICPHGGARAGPLGPASGSGVEEWEPWDPMV